MKRRDSIIEELHKLRERIGRAHDFDVDRIAATIRQHEREAAGQGRALVECHTTTCETSSPASSSKSCPTTRWSRRRVS
jgi:hypothetical protein